MPQWEFKVLVEMDRDPNNAGEAQNICEVIEDILTDKLHDTDCRATRVICLQPKKI